MKFCKKCDKKAPTIIVGEKEECMICGTEIDDESEKSNSFVNKQMTKNISDIKNLTKIDQNTGEYANAQTVGRNISIGILVILIGFLYIIGGITTVITGLATIIGLIVSASVIVYILIKIKAI